MINVETMVAMKEVRPIGSTALLPEAGPISKRARAGRGSLEGSLIPSPQGDIDAEPVRDHTPCQEKFSDREMALLQYLASNAGRVVTRDEMFLHVWQLNPERVVTRTVDMHIVHLRAKLGDDPKHPKLLITVRGEGYVFAGPMPGPRVSNTQDEIVGNA